MKRNVVVIGAFVFALLILKGDLRIFTYLYESRLNHFMGKYTYLIPPESPEMAEWQNFLLTMNPADMTISRKKWLEAYESTIQAEKSSFSYRNQGYKMDWNEIPADMGGRTRALMVDPTVSGGKKIWAGAATGGVWYNEDITDSASQWHCVSNFWPSLAVSDLAFDPNQPGTFYAGTGEYETARKIYRESSGLGTGIWKSVDSGKTWSLLDSTLTFKYVSFVRVVDENGKSVLYAGVVSGLYMGKFHHSRPSEGLFRSVDGGKTWVQVLPDIPGENKPFAPSDMVVLPSGRILVGTLKNEDGKGGSCILWSDTGLPGSWNIVDDWNRKIKQDPEYPVPGRVKLAFAPSRPDSVYAIVGAGYYTSTAFNYAIGRYFITSGDGGKTWQEASTPPTNERNWATLSWHAFSIAVHPLNSQFVLIAGLDLYRTQNGGNNWERISDWAGMYDPSQTDYVHADIHELVFGTSPDHLIIATDGGVFQTFDISQTSPVFEQVNKNFNTLQFYTVDAYPVPDSSFFIGGLQDNGSLFYTSARTNIYHMVSGGDGAYCFFDDNEPGTFLTSVYYNRYYLFKNWKLTATFPNYSTGIFINPADYDDVNQILYANACMFDGTYADMLIKIPIGQKPIQATAVPLNTGSSVPFTHIRVSPREKNVVYVGTMSGKVFKIRNISSNPDAEELTGKNFPDASVSCIAFGGSEDTILVTFSNYDVPSVFLSVDGGQTWVNKEANLPDMPVRWALFHPENSSQVLLATETGVWGTTRLMSSSVRWEPYNNGLPAVRVDMLRLRYDDNTVVGATHGRGLFYAHFPKSKINLAANFSSSKQLLYPGESVDFFDLSAGNPAHFKWYFQGGYPAYSEQPNPAGIRYDSTGYFDVALVIEKNGNKDSLFKNDYIHVIPTGLAPSNLEPFHIYPVVNRGQFYLTHHFISGILKILSINGKIIYEFPLQKGTSFYDLKLNQGIYLIYITDGKTVGIKKMIVSY